MFLKKCLIKKNYIYKLLEPIYHKYNNLLLTLKILELYYLFDPYQEHQIVLPLYILNIYIYLYSLKRYLW